MKSQLGTDVADVNSASSNKCRCYSRAKCVFTSDLDLVPVLSQGTYDETAGDGETAVDDGGEAHDRQKRRGL